ncbi:MAG TPA: hypothetical protein VGE30_03900 [Candidatus Saccharimonadales bacterium]
MSKLSVLAAAVAVVPVMAFSGSAMAAGMGQTEGGDIYRVKNVTKNIDFIDTVNATCGDTVQFKVRIHNPGPSKINNVKVVATLPSAAATSFTSQVTVSAPDADPLSTSDTATVKSDKTAKLSYINGSTELLGAHNAKMSTLPDTITTTGVTITDGVGVSTEEKRFVQFSAKLNCETTPVTPPTTPNKPAELTKTGAGDIVALFAVVAAAGAVAYNWVLRRQTR